MNFYKMVIAVLFLDETFFGAAFKISGYEKKNIGNMEAMISRILKTLCWKIKMDNVMGIPAKILTVGLSHKVKGKSPRSTH